LTHYLNADAIESETVECKPWEAPARPFESLVREVREAAVGLANARGGTIVLVVWDPAVSALSRCNPPLDAERCPHRDCPLYRPSPRPLPRWSLVPQR